MESSFQTDHLKYLTILRRRWLPAAFVLVSVLGFAVVSVSLQNPIYRTKGQVIYQKDGKTTAVLGLDSAANDLTSYGSDPDRKIETELRIILSPSVLQRTIDTLRNRHPQMQLPTVDDLQGGLTVTNVYNTDIIEISYDDIDPKRAALLVNQLMQVYRENDLQTTRSTSISARKFILSQLPGVRQSVFRADMALREFKERYQLTDIELATKGNADNLSRLTAELEQAEAQRASTNTALLNLQQRLNLDAQAALTVSNISQSKAVQDSLAEVQALERKLEEARAQYQSDYPLIPDLQAKLDKARALLQAKTNAAIRNNGTTANAIPQQVGETQQELLDTLIRTEINRTSLDNKIAKLQQQRSAYLKQSTFLPGLQQQERELNRELQAAESTYQSLLKSLQDVQVSENQTISNVRIVEMARVPLYPIGPNKRAAIAAGLLGGLLLAAALIYILELLDTRLKRVEDIRQQFEYVLLGTIPKFPPLPEKSELASLPVLREPRSSVSEAYRVLQANLKFLQSDKPLKVITVASAVTQEGKSTTSANLAAALHQMGHSVLLVDLDLRRPSQHYIWELSNVSGSSDFLAGQVQNISDVTRIIDQGLEVVTAGTIPPNPLALLDSVRMATAIQDWAILYDYVILDTPPLSAAADAAVINKLSDGMILVSRPDVLDRKTAQLTKDYIGQSSLKILGLVVNGVIPENESYSNYYYYSQYSYSSEEIDEEYKQSKKIKESDRIFE
jgi:capsular exopolysaccharide synthesis family protein